jgi:hypothetical protein
MVLANQNAVVYGLRAVGPCDRPGRWLVFVAVRTEQRSRRIAMNIGPVGVSVLNHVEGTHSGCR